MWSFEKLHEVLEDPRYKVLLDKLESVRRTRSSDKVFDVIGSLLENTSLREFMIDALTDEGEQRVLQREAAARFSRTARVGLDAEIGTIRAEPGPASIEC